ncbi:MAG: T9SS type A sorting domain-containing protein [Bacteroidota bacterium]
MKAVFLPSAFLLYGLGLRGAALTTNIPLALLNNRLIPRLRQPQLCTRGRAKKNILAYNSLLLLICCLTSILPAQSPPPNDDFDFATAISALPYTDAVAAAAANLATSQAGEFICGDGRRTYWYAITPTVTGRYRVTAQIIGAATPGNDNDLSVGVYEGDVLPTLAFRRCATDDRGDGDGEVFFVDLDAGDPTFFQINLRGANTSADEITFTLEFVEEVVWNGSVSDQWTEPANWTPARVPTAADFVSIGRFTGNYCHINPPGGFAAVARMVEVDGNTLLIGEESSLTIAEGERGLYVDRDTGFVDVRGLLTITDMEDDGIAQVRANVVINTTGQVNISNCGDDGWDSDNGGYITILSQGNTITEITDNGMELGSVDVTLGTGAELSISNTEDHNIFIFGGSTLAVSGRLSCQASETACVDFDDLNGTALITVTATGSLFLENCPGRGMRDCFFDNSGLIDVRNTGSDGIETNGDCTNGGTIVVNNAGDDGIDLTIGTTITNDGVIQVSNSSDGSIVDGSIVNTAGATLQVDGNFRASLTLSPGSTLISGTEPECFSFRDPVSASGATLSVQIDGPAECGGYDRLTFEDNLILDGAVLELTGNYVPQLGENFTLFRDSLLRNTGTFAGLPEGGTVTFNGVELMITYAGGPMQNDIVLTATQVLPVELLHFTGRTEDKRNLLEWTTANEENFSHFEIQRATDGISWAYLDEVAPLSPGEGPGERSYAFEDEGVTAYYRLKMVDLDGSFSYSEVVFLENNQGAAAGAVQVYPNPSNGQFTIDLTEVFGATDSPIELYLVDPHGRKIWRRTEQLADRIIPPTQLPKLVPGVYFLSLQTGESQLATRILIH